MNATRNHLMSWLVLALLAVLGAQWLLAEPGYMLVRFRGYDYTTTVAAAVIWTAVGLFVLWLVVKLVTLPFRSWRTHRERRARARLGEGLEALHRGHYDRAGKLLAAAADDGDVEAGARIAAVRAALARGDHAAANAQLALDKANLELSIRGDIGWSLFPWHGLELTDTTLASASTPAIGPKP